MDHVVVPTAQQNQVEVVGVAAVAPVFDVVGVAVTHVAVAAEKSRDRCCGRDS